MVFYMLFEFVFATKIYKKNLDFRVKNDTVIIACLYFLYKYNYFYFKGIVFLKHSRPKRTPAAQLRLPQRPFLRYFIFKRCATVQSKKSC